MPCVVSCVCHCVMCVMCVSVVWRGWCVCVCVCVCVFPHQYTIECCCYVCVCVFPSERTIGLAVTLETHGGERGRAAVNVTAFQKSRLKAARRAAILLAARRTPRAIRRRAAVTVTVGGNVGAEVGGLVLAAGGGAGEVLEVGGEGGGVGDEVAVPFHRMILPRAPLLPLRIAEKPEGFSVKFSIASYGVRCQVSGLGI